jgi:hypothetical protein
MTDKRQRRIDSAALSIGEIFRKPIFYRVPVYQRDFAWTLDQVDTLWGDLTSAALSSPGEYFLGAIVLAPSADDKSREIVDGQQRLTLISMIFSAISEEWKDRGDEKRSTGVFRDFLGSEDRRTGDVLAKLALNENNDKFYHDLVLDRKLLSDADRKCLSSSNRLLEQANSRIRKKLKDWLDEGRKAEERLLDFEEFISGRTNLILIEVGDESDAFVIFETLNDRGLELAVSDLVKNYLFSLARGYIDKFKTAWTEMSLLVGGDNLTPFLRQYWLSEQEFVRERELYESLRNEVKTTSSAHLFIERLRSASSLYAALLNPEHLYWSDFEPNAVAQLETLILFRLTQYRTIAMAAMALWKPTDVSKLLRILVVVSFRFTIVSRQSPGLLESMYASAARAIRTGKAKSPAQVFNLLKSVYVPDDRFGQYFAEQSFSKAPIARYVLSELCDSLESDKEKTVPHSSGRITLEHILPVNAGSEWKDAIPKDERPDDYVELIGNLTLLEKGKNRNIANAGFDSKKSNAFAKSSMALNKRLLRFTSWTSDEIRTRSQELADTAKRVWRIDY